MSDTDEFIEFLDTGPGCVYDGPAARFIVLVMRRLADGNRLSRADLAVLAAEAGISPDQAASIVEREAERDEAGDVAGIMGLSLQAHPHRLWIGGRALSTWCAWDTLFVPPILGVEGVAESVDPSTGGAVRVEVTPRGIKACQPVTAVVSMVSFDPGSCESSAELRSTFCDHVHFFESDESAAAHVAATGRNGAVMSLDGAFEAGLRYFAPLMEAAAAT